VTRFHRNILLAGLALLPGAATPVRAQTKPVEVRTIGPAIPLSDEQVKAIAAKGVPAPLHVGHILRPLTAWKPKPVAGPTEAAATPALIASVAISTAPGTGAALKQTRVAPLARGQGMPRRAGHGPIAPGQLDPFSLKPDEIAVIDGQKVHIPHPGVIPAATRKTP